MFFSPCVEDSGAEYQTANYKQDKNNIAEPSDSVEILNIQSRGRAIFQEQFYGPGKFQRALAKLETGLGLCKQRVLLCGPQSSFVKRAH